MKTSQVGHKVAIGKIIVGLMGISVIEAHRMHDKGPPDRSLYMQGFVELTIYFGAIVVGEK